jgi:hypothetical protein
MSRSHYKRDHGQSRLLYYIDKTTNKDEEAFLTCIADRMETGGQWKSSYERRASEIGGRFRAHPVKGLQLWIWRHLEEQGGVVTWGQLQHVRPSMGDPSDKKLVDAIKNMYHSAFLDVGERPGANMPPFHSQLQLALVRSAPNGPGATVPEKTADVVEIATKRPAQLPDRRIEDRVSRLEAEVKQLTETNEEMSGRISALQAMVKALL